LKNCLACLRQGAIIEIIYGGIGRITAGYQYIGGSTGYFGDRVVDTALAPLREQLARLQSTLDLPDQQLKLVTVLFTDVVGSTRIGTELDPEDTLAIMDTALQRFGKVIEQHGGRVLRYMGDGSRQSLGHRFPEKMMQSGQ